MLNYHHCRLVNASRTNEIFNSLKKYNNNKFDILHFNCHLWNSRVGLVDRVDTDIMIYNRASDTVITNLVVLICVVAMVTAHSQGYKTTTFS